MSDAVTHPVNAQNILNGFHLIEADAGTGKTWTLASLVVRAIREGRFQLGEILVVTFTKAATSELAERIRQFLQAALDAEVQKEAQKEAQRKVEIQQKSETPEMSEAPALGINQEVPRLRLALAQIDTLKVQTIHGFCQSILSENSFALDLPAKMLLREGNDVDLDSVLAQWWRDKVLGRGFPLDDRLWRALFAAGLSLKVIRGVLRHALSDPDLRILPDARELGLYFSDKSIEADKNAPSLGPAYDAGEQALLEFWAATLREQEEAFVAMQRALEENGSELLAWLCGPARKLAREGAKIGSMYQDKRGQKWIQDLLGAHRVEMLYGDTGEKLVARFARSVITGLVDTEHYPFAQTLDAFERLHKVLPNLTFANALLAQYLSTRVLPLLHEHRKAKAELGFDGLLQEVYRMVSRNQQAANLLRERYPLAMIDESQDTDPLQWAIFESIYLPSEAASVPRSALIMVGDPKQSIYSFRGADVYTYLRASERVLGKHHLSVNRRSSPVVIEAINHMFCEKRLAKPAFNQTSIQFYPALDNLDQDWSRAESCFELLRFEAEGVSMPEKKQRAVQVCVEKIVALTLQANSSDIAVLVYSHAQAALIEAALEQKGIACARVSKENVWQSRWAHEFLAILYALEKSNSTSALSRALLTEPFAGESDWQSLQHQILSALHLWRRTGPQAALAGLVLHAKLSLQSYTAFQQLIELLGAELLPSSTIAEAVRWLESKTRDATKQSASAPWRLSDPSAIKLMTIHHSKGLEFDTVLLPFAWIKEKGGSNSLEVQRHHRYLQGSWHSVVDTLVSEESKQSIQDEKLAENLRLFYVAVTRAKRQLFLFTPQSPAIGSPLDYLKIEGFPTRISRSAELQSVDSKGLHPMQGPQPVHSVAKSADWPLIAPSVPVLADWNWHSYSALTRHSETATYSSPGPSEVEPQLQTPEFDVRIESDREAEGVEIKAELMLAPSQWYADNPRPSESMRFRFPKGAKAGVVLHSLFERHPFSRSLGIEQLRSQLAGAGMPEVLDGLDELNCWIDEILATPLSVLGGAPLNSLEVTKRKTELGFTLEISQFLWPQALAAIARHFPISSASRALAEPDLFPMHQGREGISRFNGSLLNGSLSSGSLLNGFLNGFMDMVFEHEGKFFILDWKSNFLGARWSDYRRSALDLAIAEHDYAVQWCLYGVALLRWLRLKSPDEDPFQKMGGVVYAFIRGMRSTSEDSGVFSAEIPIVLLRELDALMGGTHLKIPLFGQ